MSIGFNQDAGSPAAKRAELAHRLDNLNIAADIEVLETTLRQHALGNSEIQESWGDYINPFDSYRNEPDFLNPTDSYVSRPSDRRDGDNPPVFRTELELAIIRGAGEAAAQADSTAIGALETLTSYVVGKGFVWTATSEESPDAAMWAQRVIDEFMERTSWLGDLDRELFKRTRASGERFVRIKPLPGGMSGLEIYEPSWITQPRNETGAEFEFGLEPSSWKYGIATSKTHLSDVRGYSSFRFGEPNAFEFVSIEEMSHVKINVPRNVKRGVSDFYANEEWLGGSSKLLRRTVDGGTIQASIALIREWNPKATNAAITSAADALVQYDSKLPNQTAGSPGYDDVPTERYYSGKTIDIKQGEYKPGPLGSNAGAYLDIAGAGLRKAANRWNMPEFMISGDASNANYASTLVSESPFVKFCEHLQRSCTREDKDILWRVIKNACDAGRIPYSYQELRGLVDLDAAVPDVSVRNKQEEHTIRKDQNQAGILSRQSWAEASDLDYEEEKRKLELEPPVGPEIGPSGQTALAAAIESVESVEDAQTLIRDLLV